MRYKLAAAGLLLAMTVSTAARADLKVFSCLPEWTALTKEIGGNTVEIFNAASPTANPDDVPVTPALIAALASADLLVCTGGGFEDEWLNSALQRAQNPKLAKGKPGLFFVAETVKFLKAKEEGHDNKGGHKAHDEGNPHVQGDPRRVRTIAGRLARRMADLDPTNAAKYGDRAKTVIAELGTLISELEKKAAPLRGIQVVVQHEHSNYVLDWLKINTAAVVEPNIGVAPGPADFARVIDVAAKTKAKFALYAAYEDPRSSKYVTDRTKLPLIKLPFTVGGTDDSKTLADFYRSTVDRLLDGLAGRDRS